MSRVNVNNIKLGKGTVNDAMPLKAACGHEIDNWKSFWASQHQLRYASKGNFQP